MLFCRLLTNFKLLFTIIFDKYHLACITVKMQIRPELALGPNFLEMLSTDGRQSVKMHFKIKGIDLSLGRVLTGTRD